MVVAQVCPPVSKEVMKRAIIALLLMSGSVQAEVLVDGKVYQTTADRIIKREALVCAYGDWQFQTLPDGSTAIVRGKYCVGRDGGK